MKAIVAVDNNWGIGRNNDMLISIPDDMRFFVDQTTNKVVVMGRNTLESLPGGRPLKNRINIVVSKSMDERENVITVRSLEKALKEIKKYDPDKVMIIGGDSIYKQFIDYCDECIVTKIHEDFPDVDCYFPNLDEEENWELETSTINYNWEKIQYNFNWYKNKNVKDIGV